MPRDWRGCASQSCDWSDSWRGRRAAAAELFGQGVPQGTQGVTGAHEQEHLDCSCLENLFIDHKGFQVNPVLTHWLVSRFSLVGCAQDGPDQGREGLTLEAQTVDVSPRHIGNWDLESSLFMVQPLKNPPSNCELRLAHRGSPSPVGSGIHDLHAVLFRLGPSSANGDNATSPGSPMETRPAY